jgi:arginase
VTVTPSRGDGWDLIVTPWHLDEHIPAFPVPARVTETIRPDLPPGPVPGRMTLLHQAVADAVARAARPLLLSGDCPTALAAVAGLQRRHRDLVVVWLDAHGDFNTPAITVSGYLGGMALAMLTDRSPELFCDALGLRPVPDTSVVLADARDLDPAERDALTADLAWQEPAR